jgi:hypothetical protein
VGGVAAQRAALLLLGRGGGLPLTTTVSRAKQAEQSRAKQSRAENTV